MDIERILNKLDDIHEDMLEISKQISKNSSDIKWIKTLGGAFVASLLSFLGIKKGW